MTVTLEITLPKEMFTALQSAAARSSQSVSHFAKEVLESDLATRKLVTLPPIPKKPGGKPDIFERLNLK